MWAPNSWNVVAGEEAKFVVHLLDSNGDPLNISGATAVKMQIKQATGGHIEKSAESGFSWGRLLRPLFIYGFTLSPEETAALQVAPKQNILMKICFGELHSSYVIKGALSVENPGI